eukprot:XP_025013931.1 uncharacterized protein LOC112535551 [Ricinus communis]
MGVQSQIKTQFGANIAKPRHTREDCFKLYRKEQVLSRKGGFKGGKAHLADGEDQTQEKSNQDLVTGRTIGLAKVKDGLYYLEEMSGNKKNKNQLSLICSSRQFGGQETPIHIDLYVFTKTYKLQS